MKSRRTRVLTAGLLSALVLTDISVVARQAGKTQQTDSASISTLKGATADAVGAQRQSESSVALKFLVELFYLTKALETVTRNKDLLEKFAKITEARYAVGKGIQQDVLQAQDRRAASFARPDI